MNHLKVDFERFKKLGYSIVADIKRSGIEYNEILCPLRGGFMLSYLISNNLNIPVNYLEISSYAGQEQREFKIGHKPDLAHGKYLLCDDIYDSGKTIKKILEIYKGIDMDVACLISKHPIKEYYIGEYIDDDRWVDFFWETL
ncbi:MAG: phosphoribosyltransferase [Spirochaetes bacterium]|jgi:hypoxanthine phosphoribosyltransferase|nr:phosphoribosyltransferase [Spirochaetota bacterium]